MVEIKNVKCIKTKEWHQNRINELKFQRDVKINQDNRLQMSIIALFSVVTIVLMRELDIKENPGWIILLAICFTALLFMLNREKKYDENIKIQRNYDFLLKNKK